MSSLLTFSNRFVMFERAFSDSDFSWFSQVRNYNDRDENVWTPHTVTIEIID